MEGSEPMYAGILSVSLCSAVLLVPDRAPIGEEKTPDVETAWYDQLQREGRLTIDTDEGKIVFLPKEIAGRMMMDVTIHLYDAEQKMMGNCRSKAVKLRFDAVKNRIVMELRECKFVSADNRSIEHYSGSVSRTWGRSMPKKK
jgi:hypothetical protein